MNLLITIGKMISIHKRIALITKTRVDENNDSLMPKLSKFLIKSIAKKHKSKQFL